MGLQREVKQRGAQVPKGGREKGSRHGLRETLTPLGIWVAQVMSKGFTKRVPFSVSFSQTHLVHVCVCARVCVCVCVCLFHTRNHVHCSSTRWHSQRKQKVCLDVECFRVSLVEQMTTCKPIRALSLCSNLKLQQNTLCASD